jgi:hypothetical protein
MKPLLLAELGLPTDGNTSLNDDVARRLLAKEPAVRGKLLGDIISLTVLPAVGKAHMAVSRNQQRHANLQVALALQLFHRDQKHYPESLAEVSPRYLSQIPEDVFSGKDLIYRPGPNGYLLYSVGINGIDENGSTYDDNPKTDDLTIRMPLPRTK